eukprot:gnl/Dysnectes_brevis/347_a382_6896.p1 GENE.gnl/Dysnectes_brevis/347_a382_6896~~gnl/Dysnectes_brevis/347_a382_6896.p1  ORF type:complete len:738 (-),score=370.78 gnl/Dysnectes_brevis/347_a382_6896:57-2270(-)
MSETTIYYTYTDEAPMLATHSFLPIIEKMTKGSGIKFETKDISLASRVISQFPEFLKEEERMEDALASLGKIVHFPNANIIKLPNISASVSQLTACIAELRAKGIMVPEYPQAPTNDEEASIKKRYAKCLGSAVNPVLREGNADRRVAAPVKAYARANPHSMGEWVAESQTRIANMEKGDFFGSELSWIAPKADDVRIELHHADGVDVLKASTPLLKDELIDATCMQAAELCSFLEATMEEAKAKDVLLSLHLKATMMKVSDPIIFGFVLKTFFKDLFAKHGETLAGLGFHPNNGLDDLYKRISGHAEEEAIKACIEECKAARPRLAMVDSDKGVTNLHVSSHVIIDASVPAMVRAGGKMWGPDGKLDDTIAIIPDRSYAGMYQASVDHCKEHGAFDPRTMGNVANVGLMAKKAEEYGSHNKTFQIQKPGVVKVVNQAGEVVIQHDVHPGDIWRMCQTKDVAIRDWVKLAVTRGRLTGNPVVFWLDARRSHDSALRVLLKEYLKDHDTTGVDISVLNTEQACMHALERCREGKDTIAASGNVLRDYITDLFPILELGTSAKMLSIVPLLAGGGLFETGAGGSAPKHVQQFVRENHLRWDSLGEYLALGVSLEDIAIKQGNKRAQILADTLGLATCKVLDEGRSPMRDVGELDNRGGHFYLAMYWVEALANQTEDAELAARFAPVLAEMLAQKETIVKEYSDVQGSSMEIDGYYFGNRDAITAAMRPSATFNAIIDSL